MGISFSFLYEFLHCGDNFLGILLKCKFKKIAKFSPKFRIHNLNK